MKFYFLFAIFFPLGVFASDSKPLELPDFSKVRNHKPKSGISVSIDCKTASGKRIPKNSPKYRDCLKNAKNKLHQRTSITFGKEK